MKIEGRTFQNEEIRLDFGNFENCKFDGCTMIYGGYGPVSMTGCGFSDVRWEFTDAAANTVEFMTSMYRGAGEGGRQLIEATIENIRHGP